jgi:hypothetical protein
MAEKTNGPNVPLEQIAGETLRKVAFAVAEEANGVTALVRKELDNLDRLKEELIQVVTEKCDRLATETEDSIAKSRSAIKSIQGVIDMLSGAAPRPQKTDMKALEGPSMKAFEDALAPTKNLGAKKPFKDL